MDTSNEKRKDKIILLILGLTTVLVALIGATFAAFTAIVNNVNGNQSVVVTTTTVKGLVYDSSEPLILLNALPGDYAESTFTIENPNANLVATYEMKLVTDKNTLENIEGDNQLVLTITGEKIIDKLTFDLTNGQDTSDKLILKDIDLDANGVDEYKIRIDFIDTDKSQDTNKEKTYIGHIEVEQSIVTTKGE